MKVEHIALWVQNLEKMKKFYTTYFKAKANTKYCNQNNQFESYFLTFVSGTRLEIMYMPAICRHNYNNLTAGKSQTGYAHLAFATGSKKNVDILTQQLKNDKYTVLQEPRTTGDGYYESVVLDPEQNIVEITI